ncbi:MAG: alkaline phosphatase family protein [Phycisphaerales bacterium JB039]
MFRARSAAMTVIAAIAALAAAQPADGPGAGAGAGDREAKVLLIGVDGLRPDAMVAARTPNLDRLMAEGCWTLRAHTGSVTVSGPGWSSLLCGVWMDKHGVADNNFMRPRYNEYPHFFQRLREARPDIELAHFADWLPIDEKILGPFEADHRFAVDYTEDGDVRSVAAATGVLRAADPDVTFFYFADVDVAGHAHGFSPAAPAYLAEIEQVDGQIGALLDAIRGRDGYEQEDWLIIVSTDHGGTIDGAHGRDEPLHREIPMIISGPGAARGELIASVNQVDIPATVCAHLGIEQDPAWQWDGRPVGLAGAPVFAADRLFNGDAEWTLGYTSTDWNAGAAGWTDLGAMTLMQYGAEGGFPGPDSPGPEDRGRTFFCGGKGKYSEITQMIDLRPFAETIDEGRSQYFLDGWLGGYAEQRDLAWVEAVILDERGGELQRAQIGPVTVEDRREAFGDRAAEAETADHLTGLLRRHHLGLLPKGARAVRLRLVAEGATGDNDGYADNIRFQTRTVW